MGIISTLKCRIINYIKSKSELLKENEVFNKGELIIETNENNVENEYKYTAIKIGDGVNKYSELPYFYRKQRRDITSWEFYSLSYSTDSFNVDLEKEIDSYEYNGYLSKSEINTYFVDINAESLFNSDDGVNEFTVQLKNKKDPTDIIERPITLYLREFSDIQEGEPKKYDMHLRISKFGNFISFSGSLFKRKYDYDCMSEQIVYGTEQSFNRLIYISLSDYIYNESDYFISGLSFYSNYGQFLKCNIKPYDCGIF